MSRKMDFAEKLCDEIAMIDHGKIILSGSLPEIKNRFAEDNITLSFNGDISFLRESRLVESIEDFGNTTGIKVKKEAGTQALLKLLVENNINISSFDANQISLHDIFIKLAGKEE